MTKKITKVIAGLGALAFVSASILPLTSYAAPVVQDVDVEVTINSTLGMTLSGTSTATVANNTIDNSTLSTTATVTTNNAAGYTLTFNDTDSNTSLVSGANTIPSTAGTLVATTSSWGYSLSATPTSVLAIPTVATDITGTGTGTTGPNAGVNNGTTAGAPDKYTVYYGVAVSGAQASGTYVDNLTFTATAK